MFELNFVLRTKRSRQCLRCFRGFVNSPLVNRIEKRKIMSEVLSKISVGPLTTNLFDTLAENNRLSMTDNVVKSFEELMTAHKGEIVGKVTTAAAMDPSTEQEVKKVNQTS